MRLGGPTFTKNPTPDQWADELVSLGYSTTFAPASDLATAKPFVAAATNRGITIAEVGAWSNPISRDPAERKTALDLCCNRLALADEINAGCCVNIAGSRGPRWDGPDSENLSDETFELIVQSVRTIIDSVKPRRSFYSLETMPWIFPDSPDSYLALLRAIDRKQFAVHLDIVNMINCPARAYRTGDFIRDCFNKLGQHIHGIHAKDIRFASDRHLTLHLDECRPGEGLIDFSTLLREVSKLHRDTPVCLEHLPDANEYALAAGHLRKVAADAKLAFI